FIFMAQDGTGTMSNLAMVTITVRGNTTTTVSSSAAPSVYGQSVTFTATVAPASATGTVQFKVDGNDFGTKNLSDGSATSDATSTLTVGDHTITAIYSGDDNFVGSTSPSFTQTVTTRQTTTTVALSPSAVVVGQASTVTVTVKDTEAAGGGPFTPTGTVGITLGVGNESVRGTRPIDTRVSGTATCKDTVPPTTQPGTHTITATFAATSVHSTSADTKSLTVTTRATTTTVALSPSTVVVGQASTVTVTVQDTAGVGTASTPTGT